VPSVKLDCKRGVSVGPDRQNTRVVVSNWVEANGKKSGASYIVCA
jgi:hypothetical protein